MDLTSRLYATGLNSAIGGGTSVASAAIKPAHAPEAGEPPSSPRAGTTTAARQRRPDAPGAAHLTARPRRSSAEAAALAVVAGSPTARYLAPGLAASLGIGVVGDAAAAPAATAAGTHSAAAVATEAAAPPLSAAATALLTAGAAGTGYIHAHPSRVRPPQAQGGSGGGLAPRSTSGSGGGAVVVAHARFSSQRRMVTVSGTPPGATFMQSLRLPRHELEALAARPGSGAFVYARPRRQGPDVPLPAPPDAGSGDAAAEDGLDVSGAPPPAPPLLPSPGTAPFYAFPSVYDMEAVPHADVDPADYYTVSAAGVTHFRGGGGSGGGGSASSSSYSSTFTPLPQWEREHALFQRLRAIPLFAQHRMRKGFAVWRAAVRAGKRASAVKALSGNLFILSPPLRGALVRLVRLCAEVRTWALFTRGLAQGHAAPTFSLPGFVDAQAARRVEVSAWLTSFGDDVRGLVRGACDAVLDAFLADNRIAPQHRMTFMERAALRSACRRLRRFIKTADFVIRDALVGLALDSARQLLSMFVVVEEAAPPAAATPALLAATASGDEGGGGVTTATVAATATASRRPPRGTVPQASVVRTELPPEAPPEAAVMTSGSGARRDGTAGAQPTPHSQPTAAAAVSTVVVPHQDPLLEVTASYDLLAPTDATAAVAADSAAGASYNVYGTSGTARAVGARRGAAASEASSRRSSYGDGSSSCAVGSPQPPAVPASADATAAVPVSPLLVDNSRPPQPPLVLAPSLQAVKSALRGVLFDGMVVVSVPPRLLSHPDLAPYTKAAADDAAAATGGGGDGDGGGDDGDGDGGVDLTEAVTSHPEYKRLPGDLLAWAEHAYAGAEAFCAAFAPHLTTHARGRRTLAAMDAAGYAASVQHLPPAHFDAAIAAYRAQQAGLARAPSSADIGVLRLDCAGLKRGLLPVPDGCLAGLKQHIPTVLAALADGLTADVRRVSAVLTSSPPDVGGFLDKAGELEAAVAGGGVAAFREREARIAALARTMAGNAWPLAGDVTARFGVLADALAELDGATAHAAAARDADVAHFRGEVEAMVPPLEAALAAAREQLNDAAVSDADAAPAAVVRYLHEQRDALELLAAQAGRVHCWQAALAAPVPASFDDTLAALRADLDAKAVLWEGREQWDRQAAQLGGTNFAAVDTDALARSLAEYTALVERAQAALPGNPAVGALRASLERYRALLPVLAHLRAPALARRHWDALCALLRVEAAPPPAVLPLRPQSGAATTAGGGGDITAPVPSSSATDAAAAAPAAPQSLAPPLLTVQALLDADATAPATAEAVARVAADAAAEAALAAAFDTRVAAVWAALDLPLVPYRGSKELCTLGAPDGVIAALEASAAAIGTFLASPHVGHIRSDVEAFQRRLGLLGDTLDAWLGMQAHWVALEPALAGEETQRQLGDEWRRFAGVDRAWRALMRKTGSNPNALTCATVKGLRETLARHRDTLAGVADAAARQLHAVCIETADALGRSKAAPEERARAAAQRVVPALRADVGVRLAELRAGWGATQLAGWLPDAAAVVRHHLAAAAAVPDDVPPSLLLGLAYIHVGDVRACLARKHGAVAGGVLATVSDAAAALAGSMLPPLQEARGSGSTPPGPTADALVTLRAAYALLDEGGYALPWAHAVTRRQIAVEVGGPEAGGAAAGDEVVTQQAAEAPAVI